MYVYIYIYIANFIFTREDLRSFVVRPSMAKQMLCRKHSCKQSHVQGGNPRLTKPSGSAQYAQNNGLC